jgi:hypothetical protein
MLRPRLFGEITSGLELGCQNTPVPRPTGVSAGGSAGWGGLRTAVATGCGDGEPGGGIGPQRGRHGEGRRLAELPGAEATIEAVPVGLEVGMRPRLHDQAAVDDHDPLGVDRSWRVGGR